MAVSVLNTEPGGKAICRPLAATAVRTAVQRYSDVLLRAAGERRDRTAPDHRDGVQRAATIRVAPCGRQ